jgi:hypothetical protein
MKTLSKKLSVFAVAAAISLGALAPRNASAYIIVGGRILDYDPLITTAKVVLCIWFLPICLIDGDGSNASVSTEALAEQGYLPQEIAQIKADQKYVAETFASKNLSLGVNEYDTRESIRNDILSVAPLASETYINFIADMKGLK